MIGTEKKASESEILLVGMENQGSDEDINIVSKSKRSRHHE